MHDGIFDLHRVYDIQSSIYQGVEKQQNQHQLTGENLGNPRDLYSHPILCEGAKKKPKHSHFPRSDLTLNTFDLQILTSTI